MSGLVSAWMGNLLGIPGTLGSREEGVNMETGAVTRALVVEYLLNMQLLKPDIVVHTVVHPITGSVIRGSEKAQGHHWLQNELLATLGCKEPYGK